MNLSKHLSTLCLALFLGACENTLESKTANVESETITAARARCETLLKEETQSCDAIIDQFEVCVNANCNMDLDENILQVLVEKYGNDKGEVLLEIRSHTHKTKTEKDSVHSGKSEEEVKEWNKKEIAHAFYDECSKVAPHKSCLAFKYKYAECELEGKETCEEYLNKAIDDTTPEASKDHEKHVFYESCIQEASSASCISLKPEFIVCLDEEISEESKAECTEELTQMAITKDKDSKVETQPKDPSKDSLSTEDQLRHEFYDACIQEASSNSCIALKSAYIDCLGKDLDENKIESCQEDKIAEASHKDTTPAKDPKNTDPSSEKSKEVISIEDQLRHEFYYKCAEQASSSSCIALKPAFINCLGNDLDESKIEYCQEDKTAEALALDTEAKEDSKQLSFEKQ